MDPGGPTNIDDKDLISNRIQRCLESAARSYLDHKMLLKIIRSFMQKVLKENMYLNVENVTLPLHCCIF